VRARPLQCLCRSVCVISFIKLSSLQAVCLKRVCQFRTATRPTNRPLCNQ
jgi:hypothetical protein